MSLFKKYQYKDRTYYICDPNIYPYTALQIIDKNVSFSFHIPIADQITFYKATYLSFYPWAINQKKDKK